MARRLTESPLALFGFLVVSAVMVAPVMDYRHFATASHEGDGRLIAWAIGWFAHALTSGESFFDANIFEPTPASLATTEHMAGLGLAALPVTLTTGNAVIAMNLLVVLAPALNAFALFLLLREHRLGAAACWLGGLVFAFSFPMTLHRVHIQLVMLPGIPIGILLLDSWWDTGRPGRLAQLAAVLVWQLLVSWYAAVLCVFCVGLRFAWLALERPLRTSRLALAAGAVALAAVAVTPFALPYVRGERPSIEEIGSLSADLSGYALPPAHTWMGLALQSAGIASLGGMWGEQTLYLGLGALALGIVGLSGIARTDASNRWRLVFFPVLVLVAGLLSLGPSLDNELWRPWNAVLAMPGISAFRAPARFGIVVSFGLGALVAVGASRFLSTMGHSRHAVAISIVSLVILSEYFVVRHPEGRAAVLPVPRIYDDARAAGVRTALILPAYVDTPEWFRDADYHMYSMRHWLRIANGYARRAPDVYRALAAASDAAELARALQFYGIQHVVVHAARPAGRGPRLEALTSSGSFQLIATAETDYLFAVVQKPPFVSLVPFPPTLALTSRELRRGLAVAALRTTAAAEAGVSFVPCCEDRSPLTPQFTWVEYPSARTPLLLRRFQRIGEPLD